MARKRQGRRAAATPPANKSRVYHPDWTIVYLALAGLLVTGYLTFASLFGAAPVGCGEGSACDLVQQSRWSILLGLPIALWGFGLYLVIGLIAGLGRARLKRWQTLWTLSFFGVILSVYLTVVGWVELRALCIWCLASLAIISAMFGVLTFRRPESAPGMPWAGWLMGKGAMVAVLMVGLHGIYAGWFEPSADPRLQALAEHLDERGAVYYGASWCPACQEQNSLFGPAAEHLPYVECSPGGRGGGVAFECADNDVTSFPTWEVGGRRLTEVLTPEELAEYSRFDWEGWEAQN